MSSALTYGIVAVSHTDLSMRAGSAGPGCVSASITSAYATGSYQYARWSATSAGQMS